METTPSLPTLPFDLIPEILCRLPVKLLLQFRCVCKSWNSLISDPKFIEKHHRLNSIFNDVTTNHIAQLEFPVPFNHVVYFVGSCNGILCIISSNEAGSVNVRLWNPSIRKFKELPRFQRPQNHYLQMYGFGHDPITDNYKVVLVLKNHNIKGNFADINEVKIHTLGTNYWKSIQKIPIGCFASMHFGKFVCGTINWLVSEYDNKYHQIIVSLNLGNDFYKEISLPEDNYAHSWHRHLGVLRDCLCIVFDHDVWVMKEHGNKDSWTKLFIISYIPDFPTSHDNIKVVHMFEDGQVLLMSYEGWTRKLIFYNSRNGTFKFIESKFVNTLEVCLESLISPCS